MTAQSRKLLLLGGLFLVAAALVAALFFTNQTQAELVSTPTVAAEEDSGAATVASPAADAQSDASLGQGAAADTPAATAVANSPLVTPTSALVDNPTPTLPPPVRSGAAGIPVYTYRVVATFPHDPDAFTQGLQYVDGEFYEGTGLYGRSSLRRVDLVTGEVLQQINLTDDLFGEGIAVVDDRIYQLSWQGRRGFVYERASFDLIDEFAYQTEGWGLTFDGESLIMSDGSNILYWRDPTTLAVERQVAVQQAGDPVLLLNELEYIDGEIFANVWQTNWIARIDPATGNVVGWIDLTGLLDTVEVTPPVDVLNGIAYDATGDRLFVTGKLWPALFEIELVER